MYGERLGGDMTKRIGDNDFSVAFELNPTGADSEVDGWLWGRICFIVGGAEIGDFNSIVTLNTEAVELARLLMNRGHRQDPELMRKPTVELFYTIFRALTEDRGQSDAQVAEDW